MLGIAERAVTAECPQFANCKKPHKLLQESIKTIGGWIKFHRERKNLTHWHLGAKMGIASALIQAWETGDIVPEKVHLDVLETIFSFTSKSGPG